MTAQGRVAGLDGRATVQAQLRQDGGWRTIAGVATGEGRFSLSLRLPKQGSTATLRGAVVLAGSRLAVSPPDRVRLAPRVPAPKPPASTPAATAAAATLGSPPTPLPLDSDITLPELPEPPVPPLDYALWGAWIDPGTSAQPAPVNPTAIASFEAFAKKSPSLLESYSAFAECQSGGVNCSFIPFPAAQLEAIRNRGAIPLFTWASEATSGEVNQPNFQLADVIEGKYDSYISAWATAAKAWGHPFFLRFDWEMNGNWYPWSESVNGNAPGQYVAAWQHVRDIFTAVGATNATWVWCPYVNPNGNLQSLEGLYPGDEYVDWTCLDGYNYGSSKPNTKWRSFSFLFGPQYAEISGEIAPTKPMLIAEVASSEQGGSKPAWIAEMFSELPTAFPAIRGVMWFDYFYDGNDWWLESSTAAQEAFAAAVADPRYLGNTVGGLATSPIPAP